MGASEASPTGIVVVTGCYRRASAFKAGFVRTWAICIDGAKRFDTFTEVGVAEAST